MLYTLILEPFVRLIDIVQIRVRLVEDSECKQTACDSQLAIAINNNGGTLQRVEIINFNNFNIKQVMDIPRRNDLIYL